MTPKVSVVLPVHNRQDVLPRAISSVVQQSLRDWELIVVDDGSHDRSAEIAESNDDGRIRVIRLEANRGGNAARNVGVRAAGATLIAFLDSDDAYLPQKLERVAAHFENRPELDLLVDSFIKIQPSNARIIRKNPVIGDRETFRRALFTRLLWKATPAISVRREIALKSPFDETLRRLQDFDFLIRVSEFANCGSTDEVLWEKYWDAGAISAQDTFIPANIELVRRHPEYLERSEYRPGLGYAVRLSLWRKLKKGDPGGVLKDIRDLKRALGPGKTLTLLGAALRPRPRLG
jgi:glycosyltransferase involved in cell wall biosynthesis